MNIGTENGFCASTITIWQGLGYVLLIFKIVLPISLIVLGIITLGKAVISDDDKEVKKGIRGLITKFIIAVVIFFLPSIMNGIYPLITGFDMVEKDYDVCMECFTHPKGNYCLKKVEVYNENNSKNYCRMKKLDKFVNRLSICNNY